MKSIRTLEITVRFSAFGIDCLGRGHCLPLIGLRILAHRIPLQEPYLASHCIHCGPVFARSNPDRKNLVQRATSRFEPQKLAKNSQGGWTAFVLPPSL